MISAKYKELLSIKSKENHRKISRWKIIHHKDRIKHHINRKQQTANQIMKLKVSSHVFEKVCGMSLTLLRPRLQVKQLTSHVL
jgi:hypothetical protein